MGVKMEHVFLIIARLFLAAMATFGLWSAYKLSQICICHKSGVCLAVHLKSREDAENLENTIFEAESSSFFGGQPSYPLLVDDAELLYLLKSDRTDNTKKNTDIYIRVDILPQYFGKEDSRAS